MEPAQTIQPAALSPPHAEPCPTPLAWRDVLDRFRRERADFELVVSGERFRGAVFGTGRPLYFLNPATGDMDQYALLAWRLREQFRCVLLDYPSPSRQPLLRLPQAEAAVLAVADHCKDEKISLVAAGWGGMVALHTMMSAPGRIRAAALLCGFAHRDLTWMERGLLTWGGFCPGSLSRIPGWRTVQERNHRPWFPPYDETRWDFLRSNLGATRIRDAARRLALLPITDLRPRLSEVQAPVLIVHTEGDGPLLTRCQQDLRAGLPAANTEWLHTTGHYSCLTHPHRLAKLITSFLDNPLESLNGATADAGGAT